MVGVVWSSRIPHILNPDQIFAVLRRVEGDAGILAKSWPAVVVAISKGHRGSPAGREPRPWRMDLHLVDGLAHRVMLGGRLEHPDPPPLLAPELAIVVGIL